MEQKPHIPVSLDDIWQQFCKVKKSTVAPSSWKNGYLVMSRHLARCPIPKTLDNADAIYDWAVANLTSDTAKRPIVFLTSCCDWAKRYKLIESNPFESMDSIKVVKQVNEDRDVNPFSKEERDTIIKAFSQNRYYKYYAPFVKFLFYTGCRPSEAIALQWKHIGKSKILFEQSVVDSVNGSILKKG